jgi:hypothetical protein
MGTYGISVKNPIMAGNNAKKKVKDSAADRWVRSPLNSPFIKKDNT